MSLNNKEIEEVLFYLFVVATAIQLIYYWLIFSRTAFYKNKKKNGENLPPLSVVISARNEYHNLKRFLKDILEQDYPDFEVLVVNDQSVDDTEFYLKSLQEEYPMLKVVNINNPVNFFKGKKFPLSIGIKSAAHDILVLTDADCKPASPQWLREIAAAYDEKTEIVLGYGAYMQSKGLLNLVVRFETLRTAVTYLSMALAGMPYMGVGRNLSYRKSLFYRMHGFQSHYKIPSGDDDLFVNMAATSKNTRVVISPQAKTLSAPVASFKKWWSQKRRHLSTGAFYKKKHLIVLAVNDLSYLMFIALGVFLLLKNYNIQIIWAAILIRYVSFLFIIKKSMIKFGETKLLVISLLLELWLALLMPVIALTNIFYKGNKWK